MVETGKMQEIPEDAEGFVDVKTLVELLGVSESMVRCDIRRGILPPIGVQYGRSATGRRIKRVVFAADTVQRYRAGLDERRRPHGTRGATGERIWPDRADREITVSSPALGLDTRAIRHRRRLLLMAALQLISLAQVRPAPRITPRKIDELMEVLGVCFDSVDEIDRAVKDGMITVHEGKKNDQSA